MHGTQTHNLIK